MNAKLTITENDAEYGARIATTIDTADMALLVVECLKRMEPMQAYMLLGRLHAKYGKMGVNG